MSQVSVDGLTWDSVPEQQPHAAPARRGRGAEPPGARDRPERRLELRRRGPGDLAAGRRRRAGRGAALPGLTAVRALPRGLWTADPAPVDDGPACGQLGRSGAVRPGSVVRSGTLAACRTCSDALRRCRPALARRPARPRSCPAAAAAAARPGRGGVPACAARLVPSWPVLPGGPPVVRGRPLPRAAAHGRARVQGAGAAGPGRPAGRAALPRSRPAAAGPAHGVAGARAVRAGRGGPRPGRRPRAAAVPAPRPRRSPAAGGPGAGAGRRARDSVGLDAAARVANLAGRLRVRAGGATAGGQRRCSSSTTSSPPARRCARAGAPSGARPGTLRRPSSSPTRHAVNIKKYPIGRQKNYSLSHLHRSGSLDPQICCRTVISDTVGGRSVRNANGPARRDHRRLLPEVELPVHRPPIPAS